jgi:aldose 1-epimerase
MRRITTSSNTDIKSNKNAMNLLKQSIFALAILGFAVFLLNCKGEKKEEDSKEEVAVAQTSVRIDKSDFGTTPDGEKVDRYTLANDAGMEVDIITYGGIITSLKAPDNKGNYVDVVLGFDTIDQYIRNNPYFGALIGRYGNRIANGEFELNGETYSLAKNDGANHLHGGAKGFDKVVWQASTDTDQNSASLVLTYVSKDDEEGYPGTLEVAVTYSLNNDNSLDIQYEASTDKQTIVNLTNHSYFNLSGDFSQTILDHVLEIDADGYLPVDEGLIPTGKIEAVAATPFDFRQPKAIGDDINAEHGQIELGRGFDHCWVLNTKDAEMSLAARAVHPESGRVLEVITTEPGVQFYSGNFLDGSLPAKGGGTYARRSGFCLETQHYPDSPNQSDFPSVVLNPGDRYISKTTFKFSTR